MTTIDLSNSQLVILDSIIGRISIAFGFISFH